MGLSRVEKFKEYRKSILSEDTVLKTPIDTNLTATSIEPLSSANTEEAVFINKIIKRKRIDLALFFGSITVLLVLVIVFGIIVF